MRKISKVLVLVLSAIMVLAMSITVFAAPAADGSITIDNAVKGEDYTLYKIFDLTYGSGGTSDPVTVPDKDAQNSITGKYVPVSYSYTKGGDGDQFFAALQGAATMFELERIGTTDVYNVIRKTGTGAASDEDVIAFMKENISKLPSNRMIGTQTATSATVQWTDLAYGYYYVTSSLGSLVTIDSTLKDATVKEKNVMPSDDKNVKDSSKTEETWVTDDNAQIGDTVDFKLTVIDGKGTDGYIVLHDTMSSGLTLKIDSFEVKMGTEDVDPSNYKIYVDSNLSVSGTTPSTINKNVDISATDITDGTVTVHTKDSDSFVIVFKNTYVATLKESDQVTVTYKAILNDKAVVGNAETNKSHITYSNQSTTEKEVKVHTYDVDILKYANEDKTKPIADAVFQLQSSNGTRIWLTPGTAVSGYDVYEVAENQDPSTSGLTEVYDTRDTAILIGYKDSSGKMVLYNAFVTTANKKVRIDGIDVDVSYLLEELEAPSGFNKLTDKVTVEATGTPLDFPDKEIENKSGVELPSTGGIGTTIFYIVGSLLVIGCGIVLVSRRRMRDK